MDKKLGFLSILMAAIVFGIALIFIGNLTLYGFSHFDLNLGTIILSTELFFSLIINYIFLKEVPTSNELLGGVLIFLAMIVINLNIEEILVKMNLKKRLI